MIHTRNFGFEIEIENIIYNLIKYSYEYLCCECYFIIEKRTLQYEIPNTGPSQNCSFAYKYF